MGDSPSAAAGSAQASREQAVAAPEADDRPTVLLAEDDDGFRETLRLWVEADGGWEVREAENGRVALEKLDETVDVLSLDRQMPGYSGADVVSRLEDSALDCAVVVLSCLDPNDRLNDGMVEEYVVKPIERDEFLELLHGCL